MEEVCWPLLMDLCAVLGGRNRGAMPRLSDQPSSFDNPHAIQESVAVPIVLTAPSGIGSKLAHLVLETATKGTSSHASEEHLRAAWAALHCVSHAVPKPKHAWDQLKRIEDATSEIVLPSCAVDKKNECSNRKSSEFAPSGEEDQHARMDFLRFFVHCTARRILASVAPAESCDVAGSLAFLERHPASYHAVRAASETLARNPRGGSLQDFNRLAPLLAPNLASPCARVRVETLRVLCVLPQPMIPSPGEGGGEAHPQPPCDALSLLLSVEERPLGADSGRHAVVALGRICNYFEYKKIPESLVPLVVQSLLGVLCIRFSALWETAASALAAALGAHPPMAWPLVLGQLSAAQHAFLDGDKANIAKPLPGTVSLTDTTPSRISEYKEMKLKARFEGAAREGSTTGGGDGGTTDAATRLTHLLRALSGTNNNVIESRAKDWAPLFLAFSAAKTPDGVGTAHECPVDDNGVGGGGEGDGVEDRRHNKSKSNNKSNSNEDKGHTTSAHTGGGAHAISPRAWRSALREWLAMMAGLKGISSVSHGDALRSRVAAHVMDAEPLVQVASLKCLKAFKISWLHPYVDRLTRLADNATLRAELAAFPLALKPTSLREGDVGVQKEHREALVPVIIALLFPKMRKRSGRLGGKGEGRNRMYTRKHRALTRKTGRVFCLFFVVVVVVSNNKLLAPRRDLHLFIIAIISLPLQVPQGRPGLPS